MIGVSNKHNDISCFYQFLFFQQILQILKLIVYQRLTNPLPGRPGQVLNPAGQVCSVFTRPGRASVKKSPGQLKVQVFTVKKSDQNMSINTDN